MSQDKLEEIARLLGGISDKLDAFAREQQRMARIASRWDGDGCDLLKWSEGAVMVANEATQELQARK